MMSSRFDRSLSNTFSSLLKIVSYLSWGNCFALLDIFLDCFYVYVYCMMVIWRRRFFTFMLFEQSALVIIFIIWCVFEAWYVLNSHLNLRLVRFYCILFKYLFKSSYSVLVTAYLVKLIIFLFELDWCLSNFSIIFRKLPKFS